MAHFDWNDGSRIIGTMAQPYRTAGSFDRGLFMTVKEAAAKWGLSERRLQTICNEGMVPGVIKFGKAWAIPVDAERPVDKRIKSGRYVKEKE